MKRFLLLSLVILLLFACSHHTYPKFDYNKSTNPWIDAFKDRVFFACLRESYQNDSIFHMIEKKDGFNPYDGLEGDAILKTTELAKKLVQNMPPAELCDECKHGEKFYMANALHYYNSRELDSIAHVYYKRHLQSDKAFDKMLKKK